jgi:hypothetical protein
MESRDRHELYRSFIEFVRNEAQRERKAVNRRMFSVFLWCFLIPAAVTATLLLLIRVGIVPRRFRGWLDWLVLVFPVSYSVYFLSAEVLREIPAALRRGGIANTLRQADQEGKWRQEVTVNMHRAISASPAEWEWIRRNFRMDLDGMIHRARYLTALAGAVFFLIMQGIDSITSGAEPRMTYVRGGPFGWIEATDLSDISQFIALALFLVLLYLSSSQHYHTLRRYLNCAELVDLDRE